jgi:hypothetical protein
MGRKFFYVCTGILMLALSYHFGAQSASAQSSANPVVALGPHDEAVCANGDVYVPSILGVGSAVYVRSGNVFASPGPTPAQQESFGSLKARYRK